MFDENQALPSDEKQQLGYASARRHLGSAAADDTETAALVERLGGFSQLLELWRELPGWPHQLSDLYALREAICENDAAYATVTPGATVESLRVSVGEILNLVVVSGNADGAAWCAELLAEQILPGLDSLMRTGKAEDEIAARFLAGPLAPFSYPRG